MYVQTFQYLKHLNPIHSVECFLKINKADKHFIPIFQTSLTQYPHYSNCISRPTTFPESKLISEWIGPATVVGFVSDYGYRIALNTGAVRILHANNLRKFIARVNVVGVIYDEDKEFGEIICCPEVNVSKDEQETLDAIKNLDLSYLDEEKSKQLKDLLYKHRLVFNNRPGTCNVSPHEINLVDGFKPKALKPYRIPETLKTEVDKQVNQLLEDGKIKESSSCFAHPIVCVSKPNGDIRMCTDLRYINSGTIRDAYPMPLGEDLLLKICPANYISTLDCTAGYWQIPIKESDTYKTAFMTHRGLYEWLALPFGAVAASQSYRPLCVIKAVLYVSDSFI